MRTRCKNRLQDVHRDLARVVYRAAEICDIDFIVTCGLRTEAEQRALVKAGASQTMNSRHLTGHAVDLAAVIDGKIRWDWPLYYILNDAMQEAAAIEAVPIEWGGHWLRFKDGPHFQLPASRYPT